MKITAEFQYTLEEYKEGLSALQQSWTKTPTISLNTYTWLLLIASGVFLFLFLQQPRIAPATSTPPPAATPMQQVKDLVLPILPWAVVFIVAWIFAFRLVRTRHARTFDSTPALHRTKLLEIDDEGISIGDNVSRHQTLWSGYCKFYESENLFLLFYSDRVAEFIPKRVFRDDAEVAQVRQLLCSRISPPQSAFPVIPVQSKENA